MHNHNLKPDIQAKWEPITKEKTKPESIQPKAKREIPFFKPRKCKDKAGLRRKIQSKIQRPIFHVYRSCTSYN